MAASEEFRVASVSERSGSGNERHFDPKGRDSDGVAVQIFRDSQPLWTGVFAFGDGHLDEAKFITGSPYLVIVSHGLGYVVNVESPDDWTTFSSPYAHTMAVAGRPRCIVLADDWKLYATWGTQHTASRALDADGISDVRCRDDLVEGSYEDVSSGGTVRRFAFRLNDRSFSIESL